MTNDPTSDLAARRLVNAIRDYTPKHPRKFQNLLPMKDGIAELKTLATLLLIGFALIARADGQTNAVLSTGTSVQSVETIVCIRHGEKPHGGLGQLTCRGLNRALALPKVLLAKYGSPQFIFAPNPTEKVDTKLAEGGYYYVRPLATIEPTAIRCGLPVNTQFGYREIKGLESELQKKDCKNATVIVVWEHVLLDEFAKNLVKDNGGDPSQIPSWPPNEYDMIFVFKITTEKGRKTISVTIDHEELNGLSDTCP